VAITSRHLCSLAIAFAVGTLLSGCGTQAAGIPGAQGAPVGTTQVAVDDFEVNDFDLRGTSFAAVDAVGINLDGIVSLEFDENGRIGGFTGCNSFGAEYELHDGVLQLGPDGLESTAMLCENWSGAAESWLMRLLQSQPRFVVSEIPESDAHRLQIVMSDSEGNSLTLYQRFPLHAAVLGAWAVDPDATDEELLNWPSTNWTVKADDNNCLLLENQEFGTVLPLFNSWQMTRSLTDGQAVAFRGEGPFDELPERLPNLQDSLIIPDGCQNLDLPFWVVRSE